MDKSTEGRSALPILPLSRIRTIMKSSPEMCSLSQDSVLLMTRATELFIEHLVNLASQNVPKTDDVSVTQEVSYGDLATVVKDKPNMDFLQDIVPPKIKVKEYYEMLAKEDPLDTLV